MFLMFAFISETSLQKYHNRNILIFVKLYISGVIIIIFVHNVGVLFNLPSPNLIMCSRFYMALTILKGARYIPWLDVCSWCDGSSDRYFMGWTHLTISCSSQ